MIKTTAAAGRSLALLSSPFGAKEEYPAGTVPYWEWDQWEQLLANILMYAVGKDHPNENRAARFFAGSRPTT